MLFLLLFFYSESGPDLMCLFHFNVMVDKSNWRQRRKIVLSDSSCFRILGTGFVEAAVNILEKNLDIFVILMAWMLH